MPTAGQGLAQLGAGIGGFLDTRKKDRARREFEEAEERKRQEKIERSRRILRTLVPDTPPDLLEAVDDKTDPLEYAKKVREINVIKQREAQMPVQADIARQSMLGGPGGQGPLTPMQEVEAENFPQLAPGDKQAFLNRQKPEPVKPQPMSQFDPGRQYTAAELREMGLEPQASIKFHGRTGAEIQGALQGENKEAKPKDTSAFRRKRFVDAAKADLDKADIQAQMREEAMRSLGITDEMVTTGARNELNAEYSPEDIKANEDRIRARMKELRMARLQQAIMQANEAHPPDSELDALGSQLDAEHRMLLMEVDTLEEELQDLYED